MFRMTTKQKIEELIKEVPEQYREVVVKAYEIGAYMTPQEQFISPESIREEVEFDDTLSDENFEYIKNLSDEELEEAIADTDEEYSDDFWDKLSGENSRIISKIIERLVEEKK